MLKFGGRLTVNTSVRSSAQTTPRKRNFECAMLERGGLPAIPPDTRPTPWNAVGCRPFPPILDQRRFRDTNHIGVIPGRGRARDQRLGASVRRAHYNLAALGARFARQRGVADTPDAITPICGYRFRARRAGKLVQPA
jgi:hypothetical protein